MHDTKVRGFTELEQALHMVPEKIERNIVRSGLRAGAKVIEDEVGRQVPVSSGDLRESRRTSVRVKGGKVVAKVSVGGRGKGAPFYPHMVEFGTAAHVIKAHNGKALGIGGGAVESVHHPGAKKHPFMRTAMDIASAAAVQAYADQVKRRLTKEGIDTPDVTVDDEE